MTGATELSIGEMGQRILKNLARVQGYVDTLESELQDTRWAGHGVNFDQWYSLSLELKKSLKNLQQELVAIDWQDAV